MDIKIVSYNPGSKSAKKLAEALGVFRLRHKGRRIVLNRNRLINWGCSELPERIVPNNYVYNKPEHIRKASDKLQAFSALSPSVPMPEWTIDQQEALEWLREGSMVVCRTKLRGHSADGLVLADKEEDLVYAPLYTKYEKKIHEYRVHVFQGEVIFVQRKARKREVPDEEVNWQVRNMKNGFIFANKDVEIPKNVQESCVQAVDILCLDFGAVDVLVNKDNEHFIIEVNTAPGLAGTTLEKYTEAFRRTLL